jgi:ubiquinone/menaquinone biosynthesis C-methylase UbiE
MVHLVCPWWVGYLLLSPLRRWAQNPRKILEPHVEPGMTVLDVGCAMGFFTLDLVRLVGQDGRVVAVDLQPRMLQTLVKRARRVGLSERIETRECGDHDLEIGDLEGGVDFALAFAVAHEVPDGSGFMAQLHRALRPGGRLLLAEPRGHVKRADFDATVVAAEQAGFEVVERPTIRGSHTVLLVKPSQASF